MITITSSFHAQSHSSTLTPPSDSVCRVTHPASCESRGRISEHRSHTEGSLWGSLSSVGKQMGETDKRGSNECAQPATKEHIADLRFHGNQTLPGLHVSLLHFLLESLRGNKQADVFRGSLNRRLTQRGGSCLHCVSPHNRKGFIFSHPRDHTLPNSEFQGSVIVILHHGAAR